MLYENLWFENEIKKLLSYQLYFIKKEVQIWREIRSDGSNMFVKVCVLKSFAIFAGNHQC